MARNEQGIPVWYELLADDPDMAGAFYGAVLGWRTADSGMLGMDYRILTAADGDGVAGLMKRPDGMGAPTWLIYFGVEDVDAATATATQRGGAVHMPPTTMPGVGRMAMLTDPQGHAFYLMCGEPDERSTAFEDYGEGRTPRDGHGVWNELTAEDQDAAIGFYGAVLGLRHEGGMPMGEWGDYKFVHAGGTCIGATMNAQPGWPRGWQPYFLVENIDAAAARLRDAGGAVLQGPDQIPGGDYSIVAGDPGGVRFGMVGPRNA